MFGFLIAVAAGVLTPYAEAPLARPVAQFLGRHILLEAADLRLIAFMIMLLGAGVLATILNVGTVMGVCVGAVLGYFARRIAAMVKSGFDQT